MAISAVRPQTNVLTQEELNEILAPHIRMDVRGTNAPAPRVVIDALINNIHDQAASTNSLAAMLIAAQGGLTAAIMSLSPFIGMAFGGFSFLAGKVVHIMTNLIAEKAGWDTEHTAFKVGNYVLAILAAVGTGTLVLVACGTPLSLMTIGLLTVGTVGLFVLEDLLHRSVAFVFKRPDPYVNAYNPWQATFISRD